MAVKILLAFLLSSVKLLFAPIGFVLDDAFPLIEIAIICALGGSTGSIIFFLMGKQLNNFGKKGTEQKKNKVFSKKNILLVKIKNKFGLYGTAMTIGVISVPIGAILVGKYFGKEQKAIPVLIVASFIWSFAVTYVTFFIKSIILPLVSH